jgi:hypothetical protein
MGSRSNRPSTCTGSPFSLRHEPPGTHTQKEGEPIQEVATGGAIRIEPRERHWHGATPDAPMTHLALNVDATTEWFEKVTDLQYDGHP